ncbi:MAG: C40 family peptidase [Butyrivibrio sp.]|nr:C40 family peptidase [Butyrivibrio sp.]
MKKIYYSILSIIMTLIIMTVAVPSWAATSSDLEKKQEELEKEKEKLESEKSELQSEKNSSQNALKEANSNISEISESQNEVAAEIDEAEAVITDLLTSINLIEADISNKKEEIEKTQEEYDIAKENEETLYGEMCERIKFMYEKGELSYAMILMQAQSINDVLNKATYVEKLYEYDREQLYEYVSAKNEAEAYGEQLEEEKSELETSQYELEEEQAYMEEVLAGYEAQYDNFSVQLTKAKQDAAVYTAQLQKQTAELKKLQASIDAKQKEVDEAAKAVSDAKAAEAASAAAAKEASENKNKESTSSSNNDTDTSDNNNSSSSAAKTISAPGSATGSNIASYACQFVGNPYVAGGTSLTNGCDCSGFVMSVYKAFGISVPRTSYAQAAYGKEVSYANAQPGDVIYYGGHVGIYIGNGQIVHASTAKTGIKYSSATYRTIITVRRFI